MRFAQTSAASLQGTFSDPVGGNPLYSGQISEFLALGQGIGAAASGGLCMVSLAIGVLFTLLQWHWGALIIKQVRKMLAPPEPPMDVRRRASVRHDGPFEDDALAVERTPSEAEVKRD